MFVESTVAEVIPYASVIVYKIICASEQSITKYYKEHRFEVHIDTYRLAQQNFTSILIGTIPNTVS
jgi:hypothetical protein